MRGNHYLPAKPWTWREDSVRVHPNYILLAESYLLYPDRCPGGS